jgi:hypothetical protein
MRALESVLERVVLYSESHGPRVVAAFHVLGMIVPDHGVVRTTERFLERELDYVPKQIGSSRRKKAHENLNRHSQ